MTGYELESQDTHEIGRGGLRLPELEIKDGDFYPHDTVRFLEKLWNMNHTDGDDLGQPSKDRVTGYFVVPAAEDRPVVFAFSELTKGTGRYDSPITTYKFFAPPAESGELQLVMSFTHYSSTRGGFAGDRDSLYLQDHEGDITEMSLYGSRHWRTGAYEPDEFANLREAGMYTYDDPESQESLKLLVNKMRELKNLLS